MSIEAGFRTFEFRTHIIAMLCRLMITPLLTPKIFTIISYSFMAMRTVSVYVVFKKFY